jgi:hypothetical protein
VTRYLQPPHIADQTSHTKTRVDSLERRLGQKLPNPLPYEVTFSLPGVVTASESGRARHPRGGRLVSVDAHLQTSGSTDTILTLKKSGVSIGTLTIPASATYAFVIFDVLFSTLQEVLSVEVTSVGTGSEDLSVFCQFDQ